MKKSCEFCGQQHCVKSDLCRQAPGFVDHLTCDSCGRPEAEQAIEPVVFGNIPMMCCADCRGVEE